MIISILYECVALLGFILFLPKIAFQAAFKGKYRTNFWKRLGFGFPTIVRKGSGPIFWVHAVSVGETQAISPVVKALQADIPDATFVISSGTETGHATAKRIMPNADAHVYMPFDLLLPVKWVLAKCKPDIVILTEGDFWWRFLNEAKKSGAVTFVASGKISEGSCNNFKKVPFFTKTLYSLIDFFALQSQLYLERFQSLGIPASKLKVLGNIKSDVQFAPLPEEEKRAIRTKCGLVDEDFLLVVGSSHAPEEEIIISSLLPLLQSNPHLKLMIVPRHLERLADVKAIIEKSGLPYATWSTLGGKAHPKVILVDQMGILMKCYQIASSAFVAGSLTSKVGGHNILEPIYFGIPTLTGPHMQTQQELLDTALRYAALIQVDGTTLLPRMEKLIQDEALRNELKKNSLMMMDSLRGATSRTIQALAELTPQYFSSCKK